jgi:hydroxypyruvate reductase
MHMKTSERDELRRDAFAVYRAALERVDPAAMMKACLQLEGDRLLVRTEERREEIDLGDLQSIVVLGFGKASARMAAALEEILGDRIDRGVVAVKYGHTESLSRIELLEAGHPVPDAASISAGEAIRAEAERADADSLVISLISGGGSAILSAPAGDISLAEQQEVTKLLLASGASIGEMNTLRKHTSRVKGGRLAAALAPARSLNLILSDVVGDPLEVIASGPTVPDPTTVQDALEILGQYGLKDKIPARVLQFLEEGGGGFHGAGADAEGTGHAGTAETPKPGDPVFDRAHNIIIGSNHLGLRAAQAAAEELGYHTAVVTSRLEGEARDVARLVLGIARDSHARGLLVERPGCILLGGETTVTIRGSGRGGRNQEMALSALAAMDAADEGIGLLFGASDGNDGPTDAAGGYAAWDIARQARRGGIDLEYELDRNNSYRVLDKLGAVVKTGPTNTNVADFVVAVFR